MRGRWNHSVKVLIPLSLVTLTLFVVFTSRQESKTIPDRPAEAIAKALAGPVRSRLNAADVDVRKLFTAMDASADRRLSTKEVAWMIHRRMSEHMQR